jgi:hypothetical protein
MSRKCGQEVTFVTLKVTKKFDMSLPAILFSHYRQQVMGLLLLNKRRGNGPK